MFAFDSSGGGGPATNFLGINSPSEMTTGGSAPGAPATPSAPLSTGAKVAIGVGLVGTAVGLGWVAIRTYQGKPILPKRGSGRYRLEY